MNTRSHDGQSQRPARSPFADDHGHGGDLEPGEGLDAVGDGSGLAALLGVLAGIGPAGVDQRDQRQPELLGQPRQAHGLAIALRPGHAEAALLPLLERVALLVADQDDPPAAQRAQAAHDGRVVAAQPVAAQLEEVGQHVGDVVEGLRPVLMAGELDDVPGELGCAADGAATGGAPGSA